LSERKREIQGHIKGKGDEKREGVHVGQKEKEEHGDTEREREKREIKEWKRQR